MLQIENQYISLNKQTIGRESSEKNKIVTRKESLNQSYTSLT